MTISRSSSPRALAACAAAAFLAWSAAAALAQCTEDHLITESSPAADDQFGAGVAVEGEWLAIGSWGRDGAAGADAGAVSVFRRNPLTRDWDAVQTLTASDGGTGDHFGSAVSLDSGWLAIGAPDHDHNGVTDCGAVYVFQNVNGSWIEKGELLASDGAAGDQYGASLCVKGNTLVVGAWLDDGLAGNDTGSAYAYSYHTIFGWANEQKLTAADAAYEDKFGVSVACDDSLLVCGAYHDDDPGVGFDAGSVYVFCRSGGLWSACQKLIAGDRGINDELGASVAILGDVIAAGAPGNDETFPAVDVGAVYVFRRHGGSFFEEEKLMPGAISPFDRFGAAVGVGDDVVVGAAPGDDHPDRDMGSAFTFRHVGGFGSACGWVEDRWLAEKLAAKDDGLGSCLSVDGGTAAVGIRHDDANGIADSGSVALFVVAELGLETSAGCVTAGQTLTFAMCCGDPGEPALLALVSPVFSPLVVGVFGPDCHWELSATVPPGLEGLTATFEAFEIVECADKAFASNKDTVTFKVTCP